MLATVADPSQSNPQIQTPLWPHADPPILTQTSSVGLPKEGWSRA